MVRFRMYYSKKKERFYAFREDAKVAVRRAENETYKSDTWTTPEGFIAGRIGGALGWNYVYLPNPSIPPKSTMELVWEVWLSDDGQSVVDTCTPKNEAPKKRSQSIMDITRGFCK